MEDLQSLRHTRWMCKFHIVWIPKCRKKKLYGQLRQDLGNVFRELARQKECQIEEGHLLRDHVHILHLGSPQVCRIASDRLHQGEECDPHCPGTFGARKRNFTGQHFWARGYYVSTAGKDEEAVRRYIQAQEEADQKLDQLQLFDEDDNE